MATQKIYADFQNLDDSNRLRLSCVGTREDLSRQGIELREGLALTFYMDDADDQGKPDELRAEGIVTYNEEEHCWVAAIDWYALRHASQESDPVENFKSPNIEIEQEDNGRWIAEMPDIPGVMAYGESRQEAIHHVQALYLQVRADRLAHGEPVP